MLFPSLALVVVGEVEGDERGAAMGAFTAFFDLGVGLGGPIAGATAALAGYPAVFALGCAAALASAGLSSLPALRARRLVHADAQDLFRPVVVARHRATHDLQVQQRALAPGRRHGDAEQVDHPVRVQLADLVQPHPL